MSVTVRPVDLEADRETLFGILEANLRDLPHRRRFEWLYRGHPAGPARSWFALESGSGGVIGVASVFPRSVWIGPTLQTCGQVGDFAIEAGYRTLGPAVQLQRATLGPVERGELAFCYDCPPHEAGMSTFRRLGIDATCRMQRHARLLRADRQLAKRLGPGVLAAALAGPANGLLALRAAARRPARGIEVAVHRGRFGAEFSALDTALAEPEVIRSRRSADDLNWRHHDDPLHDYDVLTARRGGELVGFVVLSVGEDTRVIDLFGRLEGGVAAALLEAAADHGRRATAQTIQILVAEHHDLARPLAGAGFRLRDPGPRLVAHARAGTDAHKLLEQPSNWFLRHVDLLA
jgi:hypothetical protein